MSQNHQGQAKLPFARPAWQVNRSATNPLFNRNLNNTQPLSSNRTTASIPRFDSSTRNHVVCSSQVNNNSLDESSQQLKASGNFETQRYTSSVPLSQPSTFSFPWSQPRDGIRINITAAQRLVNATQNDSVTDVSAVKNDACHAAAKLLEEIQAKTADVAAATGNQQQLPCSSHDAAAIRNSDALEKKLDDLHKKQDELQTMVSTLLTDMSHPEKQQKHDLNSKEGQLLRMVEALAKQNAAFESRLEAALNALQQQQPPQQLITNAATQTSPAAGNTSSRTTLEKKRKQLASAVKKKNKNQATENNKQTTGKRVRIQEDKPTKTKSAAIPPPPSAVVPFLPVVANEIVEEYNPFQHLAADDGNIDNNKTEESDDDDEVQIQIKARLRRYQRQITFQQEL